MFRDEIFFRSSHLTSVVMVRLGNRNVHILGNRGQSTVEYILLLAVVISLIVTITNMPRFKALLGEGGSFAVAMKNEMEWNYRFASQGREPFSTITYPNAFHPSYYNSAKGSTHFIGPVDPYGGPP